MLGSARRLEQSAFTPRIRPSSLIRSEGPPSCEVPVSTATRQFWHRPRACPSMVMLSSLISQYPWAMDMGTQTSSDAMRSSLMAPNVTSELSRSELERKTENRGCLSTCSSLNLWTKLKDGPCANPVGDRPNTPSKAKDAHGCVVSDTVAMKLPREQASPTQMSSSKQRPVTWPVPNVILRRSCWPGSPARPSHLTSRAVDESLARKRLWDLQGLLAHSDPGTRRFALPVSKTTLKRCCGVPIFTVPK
mmetsp:Transcript_138412/g.430383  ORF Transcript_138412/g.430383 Transcript_138412/m.430383 type:complete len:248 (-) Transcript_138412:201-944(-)